jgi:hypothetical protein
MTGFVAGKVMHSRCDKLAGGDYFGGLLPFTTVMVLTKEEVEDCFLWRLTDVDELNM